jgi:hypothetical protein
MQEEDYRSSKSKAEILRLFQTDSLVESFIWQNVQGRRFVHRISKVEANPVLQTIHINLKQDFEYLHPQSPIYIKLTKQGTVCKARYLAHGKNDLTLYYPEQVKTLENRNEKRFKLGRDEILKATIVVSHDVVTKSTQAIQLRVLDISYSGISIFVSNKHMDKLLESRTYLFTHLNSLALDFPIQIESVHTNPFSFRVGGKSKNAFKMGFRLTKSLSREFLDSILLANSI